MTTTTTKYFAYNPEHQGAFDGHTLHDTWGAAASEVMRDDGYTFDCREITADDLPVRFAVLDSNGAQRETFEEREDAEDAVRELSEDGEQHMIERVADESRYSVGDFALWVKSRHHGNNSYAPEGVNHRDFTGITGESEEGCLRQYSERGDGGYCHPRHHIIVAEATVDDDDNLIEADGISASEDQDD